MGISEVEFRGREISASDSVLEVLLKLMVDEFDKLDPRPEWLQVMRDDWYLQATEEFGFGIVPDLERHVSEAGRCLLVCDVSKRALSRIKGFGDPILASTLNSLGAGKATSPFERDVAARVFVEPAEDLIDLLEFADDVPSPQRLWTADELQHALRAHHDWLEGLEKGRRLILTDAVFQGANLVGVNLYRAKIRRSDLKGANLTGAKLERVEFEDVDLEGTMFTGATLDRARLLRCNFDGAWFERAVVVESLLWDCRLGRVRCENANLSGFFRNVSMAGASVTKSRLRGTWIGDFRGCDFSSSDLRDVHFRHSDLRGAKVEDAVLDQTVFRIVRVAGLNGLPYWADRLRGSDLDFSAEGDGTLPGSLEMLRRQLGGVSGSGIWGTATSLEQYKVMHVDGGKDPCFTIERRDDRTEVVRVVRWAHSSGATEITYEIVDPRCGDPIAQHLIGEFLLRSPVAAELGGATLPVRYTNVTSDTKSPCFAVKYP